MGSYRTYSIPVKIAALVPEFALEDLHSAEHSDDPFGEQFNKRPHMTSPISLVPKKSNIENLCISMIIRVEMFVQLFVRLTQYLL